MSEQNIEVVKEGFEEYLRTGEPPWAILDEAIEVHDHDSPDQDVYRGHDGYARWLGDWGSAWSAWSFTNEEFIDAGERVVAVIRMQAEGQSSGIAIERLDALVYELRDGVIVRCDYFNDREQALAHAGLKN